MKSTEAGREEGSGLEAYFRSVVRDDMVEGEEQEDRKSRQELGDAQIG